MFSDTRANRIHGWPHLLIIVWKLADGRLLFSALLMTPPLPGPCTYFRVILLCCPYRYTRNAKKGSSDKSCNPSETRSDQWNCTVIFNGKRRNTVDWENFAAETILQLMLPWSLFYTLTLCTRRAHFCAHITLLRYAMGIMFICPLTSYNLMR